MPQKFESTLVITTHYDPPQDAIGSYTRAFAHELEKYHAVSVLCNSDQAPKKEKLKRGTLYKIMGHWKISELPKIASVLQELRPTTVLLQYQPFMYSPRGGINFAFCYYLTKYCRMQKIPLHVMFHELHHPWELKPKPAVMFISHLIMLFILGIGAKKILVSNQWMTLRVRNLLMGKRPVSHLPIGSTIEPQIFSKDQISQLKNDLHLKECFVVGCLGGPHPSKRYDIVLSIFERIRKKNLSKNFKVLFIGCDLPTLRRNYSGELPIESFVAATGFVTEEEVSLHLNCMDLFLGYFTDGLSTRRSSVISALAHGVPVVSTESDRTEIIFRENSHINLLPTDPEAFEARLQSILWESPPMTPDLRMAIRNYYAENFGWEKIVSQYLEINKPKMSEISA